MVRNVIAALAVAILTACASAPLQAPSAGVVVEQRAPVTILISIDGFRPDYLGKGHTPVLDGLAAEGASGPMRPSFPSKTFPNHWTIVTGERPDKHGIVANKMEDPEDPKNIFTMASDDPYWWNGAPPIWVTAEQAGVRTATMFWPGANVAWGGTRAREWPNPVSGGTRPRDWQQFNQVVSNEQRVNAVIDWLRRPAAIRPRFVTLYFDTVDTAGHAYGPDDPRTAAAVAEADTAIGTLRSELKALSQPANLVIVADHGMASSSSTRVIALDRIADAADYRLIESGPYASFAPLPGRDAALARALLRPHEHMQCWRKGEIPARFRYGTHPRIPPYLCLAELGWLIQQTAPAEPFTRGDHGYDHMHPEMAALFIAHGPAIRPAIRLAPFDNVDVQPLLARLIGIAAAPSDGNPETLAAIVRR